MKQKNNCEYCLNYIFIEGSGSHECNMDLDEDEMERLMRGSFENCPYFQFDDEYKTVRKQM